MKEKKIKKRVAIVCIIIMVALIAGIFVTNNLYSSGETLSEEMKDAVLHERNKISFFGIFVNPSVVAGFSVTALITVICVFLRIFVIPRFKTIPGKLQIVLESIVEFFDGMAKNSSPHKNKFLGAYIFTAGVYVFVSTLFELIGIQAVSTHGASIALPAPLSDVNASISLGVTSYLVILSGGISSNGFKGVLRTLKEFSLPISMSFRLFGSMLSGLLVTELVYYSLSLSIVLPVVVAVLFTLLHAIIQTYVLVMLTSVYYGEVSEPIKPKPKASRKQVV